MPEPENSPSLDRRTVAKVGVGFLVAAILLYLFGSTVGWGDIVRTFRGADLKWMLAACASTLIGLVVWAKAWDFLLEVVGVRIPFASLVTSYLAATFADYVTPFGKAGGGPFIAYVLSTDERASYNDSLASVVTADTLNLVPFFTFAGAGFLVLTLRGGVPSSATPLVGGLVAIAVAVPLGGYFAWRHRDAVEEIVYRVVRPVGKRTSRVDAEDIRAGVDEFYGLLDRIAGHPGPIRRTLVVSFAGWAFFTFPLYLAGLTLDVTLNPLLVLFVVPASTLAGVVPTPGGTGAVEAALVGLLVVLSPLSVETATALALVYRVASYWFALAVGGVAALYVVYRT